jgi:putative glutamine amidotransferase
LDTEYVKVRQDYFAAVMEAGGLPFAVPFAGSQPVVAKIVSSLDGLLLTGGADIDPAYYGEVPSPQLKKIDPKRDRFESLLVREALKRDLPILAICRGTHMLNVAAGGTLHQDLPAAAAGMVLQHYQLAPRDHASHTVTPHENTLLRNIVGEETIKVNSFHHQAVKNPAPGFLMSAHASDGVTEAIESGQHRFVLGMQWHPAEMTKSDPKARRIFQAFVKASVGTPTNY